MAEIYPYMIIGLMVVFFISFVIRAIQLLKKSGRIKREGYDAKAVISRVEYSPADDDNSETYYYYVRFRDLSGVERECSAGMSLFPEHREGDQVNIRYLPDDLEFVRIMDDNA